MAVLQKIRVKFGLAISIIIALALLSFIIDPSTLESALHSMSSKYDVGRIAGKSISYTDFQEDVDRYTTVYQIITGSTVQNEQSQKQVRDFAWQDLVDKYMFVENAKDAGIMVGKSELNDLITGENVSPVIANNPAFANEAGEFSTDNVRTFVQNLSGDTSGQLRTYWNYLQNTVLNQQYHAKYNAMFTGSAVLNKLQKADALAGNNNTFDVEFVLSQYPFEDTTIVVSDKEIKDYYEAHKEQYRQNDSRDVEYVVFEVVPSEADITKVNDEMTALIDEFASTDNMRPFLLKNSEKSLSSDWYSDGDLNFISTDVDDFVAANGVGATSPIYKDRNVFRSVRVMAEGMVPDSAYVKHILLQGTDAKLVADTVLTKLKSGENFSGLAAQYSVDKNSADNGELGNIGWMTQNYMIPGFESVITAETGKPFILNTQYGTHVVMVSRKTKPVLKKQVAVLEKTTLASNETFNNFYAKANTFATIAGDKYDGYKKALDSTGVYSHPLSRVTEATSSYGSVDQAKEVTRWIFDARKGQVSDILTVNQNYFFIVTLKDIHKEGYSPAAEVSGGIRATLFQHKIEEKCKAEVAEKIAGKTTLEEVAAALGSSVAKMEGVSFTGGQRVEPALAGAASVAEAGKVSGPVAGANGIYVFTVSNRQQGSFFTEEDAAGYESQKAMYSTQMIGNEMAANAEVKDNRARFF